MRYIDSGSRDAAQAVASWFRAEIEGDVSELRIQSGFYSRDALRPFLPRFQTIVETDGLIRIVIGSNDGGTVAEHVDELVQALGLPRAGSQLGVVYLSGAYFHPKTFHIVRSDGSQTAYVGSANFTLPGIAAKHVEAGILLDSLDGDPDVLLSQVSAATDAWFNGDRPGIELVNEPDNVAALLEQGILRAAPAPRPPRPAGQGGQAPARPTLNYLVDLPQPAAPAAAAGQGGAGGQAAPAAVVAPVEEDAGGGAFAPEVVQHTPPYPPYMRFAPGNPGPTSDASALTGNGLGGAVGLIVRLSRDNDRHWREAPGTANLSVPTSAAETIRFGFYGDRARPRAEFDLHIRYVDDQHDLRAAPENTGLMSFGYTDGDTGHGDLRLVIPRPPVAALRADLVAAGLRLPQATDLAILEWPTAIDPVFRMTVTDPDSALGQSLWAIWQNAAANGQLASRGACWLQPGVSPAW